MRLAVDLHAQAVLLAFANKEISLHLAGELRIRRAIEPCKPHLALYNTPAHHPDRAASTARYARAIAKPHTHQATITLTENFKDEDFGGLGGNDRSDRGIMLMGGTLNLHGTEKNSWTKLAQTAAAGSNTIQVLTPGDWKKGQTIVLASTDFDPHQAEDRTIAAISGNTITLDKKLDYMHFGKITFDVDERGEVGMLSRNIVVQASPDADQTLFGGHIMAMLGSKMYVSGVELNRMGQNMHLARYPIHWHLIGDGGQGQYIKNSAIHNTYSRCVTVHGTNYLDFENNVTYNNIGHCFFLEAGVEHGNQFVHTLGLLTK